MKPMKYEASEEDMKQYTALVSQLAYLEYQKNQILDKIRDWEYHHKIEEAPEQTEDQ